MPENILVNYQPQVTKQENKKQKLSHFWKMQASSTYLDGSGSDVTVVRQTGGEGGTVIERVEGLALGELKLLLESVNLLPIL